MTRLGESYFLGWVIDSGVFDVTSLGDLWASAGPMNFHEFYNINDHQKELVGLSALTSLQQATAHSYCDC